MNQERNVSPEIANAPALSPVSPRPDSGGEQSSVGIEAVPGHGADGAQRDLIYDAAVGLERKGLMEAR